MKTKPKMVITGARGKLARILATRFRTEGWEVVRVSRRSARGMIDWGELLSGAPLAEAQCVIHCAWSTVPAISEKNPGIEWVNDLPLLSRLLQVTPGGDEGPLFVFLSSGGTVYGDAGDTPSLESDPCRPKGWYGAGKVAGEQLVHEFSKRKNLASLILRASNPYGFDVPEARPQGIIPHLAHAARDGRIFDVWGDGRALKDYIYYEDFADCVAAAVKTRFTGILNVCSGSSATVRELIRLVERVTGKKIALRHLPAPAWDVQRSLLSAERAKVRLGWEPRVGLAEGVRRTVEMFL